jgi:SAM-dependent methyltransferase
MNLDLQRQEKDNRRVYAQAGIHKRFLSDHLDAAEAMALLKYQPYFCGQSVLDIGVGTGRTTRYLAPLAGRYEAIDASPEMVSYMRRVHPQLSVTQADMRDLRAFADGHFDFIFAPQNVISALSHEGRLQFLHEARRTLRSTGLLVFSVHNRKYRHAGKGPRLEFSRNPVNQLIHAANYALSMRNHWRNRRIRYVEKDYALFDDRGLNFSLIHYYISRKTQELQLSDTGFAVLEVFAKDGSRLGPSDSDVDESSLLFVAQGTA